jgi:hypothetical protein
MTKLVNPEDAVGNYSQVPVYVDPDAPAGSKVIAVDGDTGEALAKAIPFTAEQNTRDQAYKDGAPLRQMIMIREHRNNLLSATDWMANSDVTMSDVWKTYRQELRDVPASNTVFENVTWPTKPE